MDFNRLQRTGPSAPPSHPIRIFEQLPSRKNIPNDLWRGQTTALNEWDANRSTRDVLIELNTGAGKTIAGLLIAQSLVNEGAQNVLYVCSTNDLVAQTAKEAERLGIHLSTRAQGTYSNDLFQSGRAFCVTNYTSVFNSRSVILRDHFPDAVIFDDAHVAEKMLRDAFTMKIDERAPELFAALRAHFRPAFEQVGRLQSYLDVVDGRAAAPLLVPPGYVASHATRLAQVLREGIGALPSLGFAFGHLRDNVAHCAVTVGTFGFEVTPPFLPVQTMPIFANPNVRRTYLSATLNNHSDFVRAFGKRPDKIISPDNDAGNGERLVLFSRYLPEQQLTGDVLSALTSSHKTIVAVPSYTAASSWEEIGTPPSPDGFSDELQAFRDADSGVFVLVARVDGIDLPQDTCRVMIIDGLPRGASGLERFQWETLGMRNLHAARIANRLAQLFGRINRGRNDYGAFIINGEDVANWLRNDRNLALLPALLRQQVKLGMYLHESGGLSDETTMLETIEQVMERHESWLEFYRSEIDTQRLSDDAESDSRTLDDALTLAAESEATFMRHIWNQEYADARLALESTIEVTLRADATVAGWHNVWLGLCCELEGDHASANTEYARARARLGQTKVYLPTHLTSDQSSAVDATRLAGPLLDVTRHESHARFEREQRILQDRLAPLDAGTTNQQEEAVRALGEALGFTASRPDNDVNAGPDVLWVDDREGACVALELKTDKADPATYNKGDIGQGHQHLEWLAEHYPALTCLGLVFVGPSGQVTSSANPSGDMYHGTLSPLVLLRERLMAALADVRRATPAARAEMADRIGRNDMFATAAIFRALAQESLADMKAS